MSIARRVDELQMVVETQTRLNASDQQVLACRSATPGLDYNCPRQKLPEVSSMSYDNMKYGSQCIQHSMLTDSIFMYMGKKSKA